MERKSGVLFPVSALPGDHGCGGFGPHARNFIDIISVCGFSYWQALPFTVTDDCDSPYKSYSAFAGNPNFIDLNELYQRGLITVDELDDSRQLGQYVCEYGRLRETRVPLLFRAAMRAGKRAEETEKVVSFAAMHPEINKFCLFMAKKQSNDGLPWYEWTNDSFSEDTLFCWQFIQCEFFSQWERVKQYATEKNVRIIGDMPIYVDHDSSDVWSNRSQFLLDEKGLPLRVAGVPPDYFCADGQLWGNPLYDWETMEKDGFSWWMSRIDHALWMFDGVRIDHFRGFESYYSVPFGEKTAVNGSWQSGPGMKLISKIRSRAHDKLIIAEDLGDITPEVEALVSESGFPGMRVLQFGFLSLSDNPHMPHNYKNNSVAYSGTHDNNTLLGYLWELDPVCKRELLEYCGHSGDDFEKALPHIIRTLFASAAGLLILPVQDLLGYGKDTRINTPGSSEGNWRFRLTQEQLSSIDKQRFYELNRLYRRL